MQYERCRAAPAVDLEGDLRILDLEEISESNSEVKTLVTEPISKTVSPFSMRGLPWSRLP
jgi:hypothetical protein